jgi:hypothetical protein
MKHFLLIFRLFIISILIVLPLISSGQIDKKYIYNKWFGTIKGHQDTLVLKPIRDVKMDVDCPGNQSGIIEIRKDSLILEYSWEDYLGDKKDYDFIARWGWKEDNDAVKLVLSAKKNKEIRRIEMLVIYLDKDKLIIVNPSDKK